MSLLHFFFSEEENEHTEMRTKRCKMLEAEGYRVCVCPCASKPKLLTSYFCQSEKCVRLRTSQMKKTTTSNIHTKTLLVSKEKAWPCK